MWPFLTCCGPRRNDFTASRHCFQRKLEHEPLLRAERPIVPVLLDLRIGPTVVPFALRQLDGEPRCRIILEHARDPGAQQPANGNQPSAPDGRSLDRGQQVKDVPAFQLSDGLAAMLFAESLDRISAFLAAIRAKVLPCSCLVVADDQRIDGAWHDAGGANLCGHAGEHRSVCGHEFRRAIVAWKRHVFEPAAAELEADLAVAITEDVYVFQLARHLSAPARYPIR
jgi:hypothetical protein